MQIYHSGEILPFAGTVLALGTFDGLHRAHRKIIRSAQAYAREKGLAWGVMLFEEHPVQAMEKEAVPQIMGLEEKLEQLSDCDFVYLEQFTAEFRRKSCREFAQLLKERMKVQAVCVGFNYHFGYQAQGTVQTLETLGEELGFSVLMTEEQKLEGETVSSTNIRAHVRMGEVEEAARLLGRCFSITGPVEHGLQNGRKMGIPTANVAYREGSLLPANGVYAGYTRIDGKEYPSMINVGKNPTFAGKRVTVESHILNFDQDIYEKEITVLFAIRLRGEQRFSTIEELIRQIRTDIENAEKGLFEKEHREEWLER